MSIEAPWAKRGRETKEYEKKLFVGRKAELEIVNSKVHDIAYGGATAKPLLEFYAPRGMGKTWLLRHLEGREWGEMNGKRPIPVEINFSFASETPIVYQYIGIIELLWNQLHKRGMEELGDFSYGPKIPNPKDLNKIADDFVGRMKKKDERHIPIIIFDSTDQTQERVLEWLEEKVVFPLIQSDKILFITGGQRRLFWKYFEARRRVDPHELQPFSSEETISQLLHSGRLHFFPPDAVQRLTQGMPGLTTHLIQKFERLNKDSKSQQRHLDEIKNVVEKEYLPKNKISSRMAWDASVLRSFHTATLRSFASSWDESYAKKPEGFYLDMIQEMIDCGLVHWNMDRGGYAMTPSIQAVMRANLEDRKFLEYSINHNKAYKLNARWLHDYPEHAEHYLLNMLYHGAHLARIGYFKQNTKLQMKDFKEMWKDVISAYRGRYGDNQDIPQGHLDTLSQLLNNDQEVRELLQQTGITM